MRTLIWVTAGLLVACGGKTDDTDGVDEAWAEHRAMAGGCASRTEGGTPTCLYPEALGGRSATVEASESDVAVLLVRLEVR